MAEDPTGWTLATLKEHFDSLLAEEDRRYEQRFASQEQAIRKADAANDARFSSVNEFRATLSDQQRTFMPRPEAERIITSIDERLAAMAARLDKAEGSSGGKLAGWGWAVGVLGLVLAILARFVK
jgi:hypothetical protein